MRQKDRIANPTNGKVPDSAADLGAEGQSESSNNHPGNASVKSACRVLKLLPLLARNPDGMTATEVSDALRIPRASAHSLLQTMCKEGYAYRDEEGKLYTLGLKAFELGENAIPVLKKWLHKLARTYLQEIWNQTKIPAHIATLIHGEVEYGETFGLQNHLNMSSWKNVWEGRRITPHTTAVGEILLCSLSFEKVKDIWESHPIPTDSPAHHRTLPELQTKLEKTRRRGYAIDDQETAIGVRCVAAPVFCVGGRVIAAMGVSGPLDKLDKTRLPEVAIVIRKEAAKLSRKLGYNDSENGWPL